MARVAWFFDELFVPDSLTLGACTVVPLSTPDTKVLGALEALAQSEGWQADLSKFRLPATDIVAIVLDDLDVSSPEDALVKAGPLIGFVVAAIAYRQKGRGRSLGAIVDLGPGQIFGTADALRPRRITHLPFVSERDELVAILSSFASHPQGKVFADLFSEACRDSNPAAAISRLWVILEALGDRFPGRAHDQVIAALHQLAIDIPDINGKLLTRRAYEIRNDFMHEGRLAPDGEELRASLTDLVWFTLRRAEFHPIEPITNES